MNINRDYLIINDVKKSNVKLDNGSIFFYITDKNTQNIFVNLVINISNNELIQKYANIENAEDYTLTMNIVKPSNTYKVVEGKLHDKEKAIFEFNLNEDCCDEIGPYRCELLTKCNINDHEEITTSNKLTYKVKSSILNDLDDIVEAPEYPLVIQLFDKLSDINQYEEDRRANELARQLAEEQRQTKHNELVTNMTNSIQAMDNKVVDVENRISAKEEAVNTLIADTKADIDEYKVAKDQEIDDYKALKDTEINNAITAQDNKIDMAIANQNNKIDTAIEEQNNRIGIVEASDNTQNNRLDVLEAKGIAHETRITSAEEKNVEQDNRLDSIENINQQQAGRLNSIEAINTTQNNRLDSIEAINVSQNSRLDAIEIKNQQQDDRLLDVEKVNKRQDMDLKCLFAESKNNMIDVTEEGNSIYLQNSTVGYTLIDEIQGNTLVNCNKEADKEIILNGNINTQGYSNATLTEGVDGGLVDVALEGNTMVNVCDPKDPVEITSDTNTFNLKYLYTSTDYIIQFESDTEIVIDITLGGTTLSSQNIIVGINKINITTPSKLIDNNLILNGEGFNASNIVVTEATDQDFGYFEGMKSVGECEDLQVISSNSDATLSNTQTLTHEPLRAVGDIKDKYVLIDGKWYIERNCGASVIKYSGLTTNTFKGVVIEFKNKKSNSIPLCDSSKHVSSQAITPNTFYVNPINIVFVFDLNDSRSFEELINLVETYNFVYELQTPTYEPIDYNPFTVYSDVTHISNNSTIPCNMTIKNTGYNCMLKPNTTYTVSSNLGLNTVTTPSVLTEDCLRFYDTDTSTVTTMKDVTILEGDWTTKADLIPANFSGIESTFEQEYDVKKGKYKVNVKVANEDKSKENNITFYINEPLRGTATVKDRIYVKDDKVIVQRNCGIRPYEDGDFGTYLTDKVNTVYQLAEPTYEEVEYNDVKLFIESFEKSTLFYNSNIPVTSTVHYSYSVPIVDTVAQTADTTDQQDQLIIDLATQCAVMEMMLM